MEAAAQSATAISEPRPGWAPCRPGGRLDMSHGFVRHIRRNQIARDDYDREVKQAKEKMKRRHTPAPARPRKPDQQVYHLCRKSEGEINPGVEYEGSSESSSSTEPDRNGPPLFCLEYEDDNGKITSIVVHQDNDPDEVAEKVSAQNPLEPAMREALKQRVQEELEKRRVKR
uniref:Chromosome 2 open reading frame 68 n=1 Tax=Salvator merianae TaxID=96440 RepID=A0A8D0DS28_SALMN